MKPRRFLSALSIGLCASTLTGCASSIRQPPSLTARISPDLLATPAQLPPVQRQPDGSMTGGQCQASLEDVYEVAGKIRSDLITLQHQEAAKAAKE